MKRGRVQVEKTRPKQSLGLSVCHLPIERLNRPSRASSRAENRTGFEARRRRQARSATPSRPSAAPEAARDLRPHGDLRRRLVAGQRSAASQAPSLLPPHPLSFLRRRLVGVSTQSSHCQDSAGSTAPLLVNRSEVLPRTRWRVTRRAHKACSHGALTRRTHNSTPRLRRRGHILSSPEARALSGQIIAPASPAAAGRALGYRPAPQLRGPRSTTPPRSRPGKLVSWTRSVCRPRLASAPPRTQHLSIPRTPSSPMLPTPAHNLRVKYGAPSPAW